MAGTFNQSLQCTQDVFVGFQAPLPPVSTCCLSCSMSSDTIFACIFCPFSTQPHFTFFTPPFSLMFILAIFLFFMLSHSRTDDKNTIQLVQPVTKQPIYWATNIPKQSCCGSSSTQSCAGTSSATTKHSHHSKFQTSQTQSTSRSVSTT